MATRTATKGKAQATQEVDTEANGSKRQRDYSVYKDKPISTTMQAFADWLIDVTGIELPNQRAEDNFRRGVALGGTLRMDFQRSEFWRGHPENPRNKEDEDEEEEVEQPKARRGAASTTKATTTRRRGKVEPEPEDEAEDVEDEANGEDEEAETPKTATARRSGRRATATKTTTTRSGRRGKTAQPADKEEEVEAPY